MFPLQGQDQPENNFAQPQAPVSGRRGQNQQKKPKVSVAIKPAHFEAKKGLRTLYQRTKQLKLDQHSEINVESTMKRIVMLLKSWHFEMVPKYTFDLFLQRCQVLGTSKPLSAYMAKVRKIHKGEGTWDQVNPEQREGEQAVSQRQPEQEDIYPNGMATGAQQVMQVMNNYAPKANQNEEMDQDEMELFEMMAQMAPNKKKEEPKEDEPVEAYVPQGYEFDPFSESEN